MASPKIANNNINNDNDNSTAYGTVTRILIFIVALRMALTGKFLVAFYDGPLSFLVTLVKSSINSLYS